MAIRFAWPFDCSASLSDSFRSAWHTDVCITKPLPSVSHLGTCFWRHRLTQLWIATLTLLLRVLSSLSWALQHYHHVTLFPLSLCTHLFLTMNFFLLISEQPAPIPHSDRPLNVTFLGKPFLVAHSAHQTFYILWPCFNFFIKDTTRWFSIFDYLFTC